MSDKSGLCRRNPPFALSLIALRLVPFLVLAIDFLEGLLGALKRRYDET